MTVTRRLVLGAAAATIPVTSRAQPEFPSRPVRIVAPFAPGGATDILARTMADGLSTLWSQPVVVENRTGASGNMGAEAVARASKDCHVLLLGTIGTNAVNAALFPRMPYNTLADFDPVLHVADVPMLLVVHPSLAAEDMRAFLAVARERRLAMGSAGAGTSQHLAALLFEHLTGVSFENVSYRGFAALVPDLVAGRLSLAFGDPFVLLPQVRGGHLRALAVTTTERHPLLPEIPTLAESGIAGYAAAAWYGMFSPFGCPAPILAKVRRDSAVVLERREVQAKIRELGGLPRGGSAEEFGAFVRSEHDRWGAIIRAAGVRVE